MRRTMPHIRLILVCGDSFLLYQSSEMMKEVKRKLMVRLGTRLPLWGQHSYKYDYKQNALEGHTKGKQGNVIGMCCVG